MARNNSICVGEKNFEVVGMQEFRTAVEQALQRLSEIDSWDDSILPYLEKIEPAQTRSFFHSPTDAHSTQIPFSPSLVKDDVYLPLALAKAACKNRQLALARGEQISRRSVERQCIAFQRNVLSQLGFAPDSSVLRAFDGMQRLLPPEYITDEQCFDIATAWAFLSDFQEKDHTGEDFLNTLTTKVAAVMLQQSSQVPRRIEIQSIGAKEYRQQIQAAVDLGFPHPWGHDARTAQKLRITPTGRRYSRRTILRRIRPFAISTESAERVPTWSVSGYLVNEAKFRETPFAWTSGSYIGTEIDSMAAQIQALVLLDAPADAIKCLEYHLVVLSSGKIPTGLRSWFRSAVVENIKGVTEHQRGQRRS